MATAANETADILVRLRARPARGRVATDERPTTTATPQRRAKATSRRPAAWALLAASAVVLAAGGACGILSESATWRDAQNLDRATHTRADVDALHARGWALGVAARTGYGLGPARRR